MVGGSSPRSSCCSPLWCSRESASVGKHERSPGPSLVPAEWRENPRLRTCYFSSPSELKLMRTHYFLVLKVRTGCYFPSPSTKEVEFQFHDTQCLVFGVRQVVVFENLHQPWVLLGLRAVQLQCSLASSLLRKETSFLTGENKRITFFSFIFINLFCLSQQTGRRFVSHCNLSWSFFKKFSTCLPKKVRSKQDHRQTYASSCISASWMFPLLRQFSLPVARSGHSLETTVEQQTAEDMKLSLDLLIYFELQKYCLKCWKPSLLCQSDLKCFLDSQILKKDILLEYVSQFPPDLLVDWMIVHCHLTSHVHKSPSQYIQQGSFPSSYKQNQHIFTGFIFTENFNNIDLFFCSVMISFSWKDSLTTGSHDSHHGSMLHEPTDILQDLALPDPGVHVLKAQIEAQSWPLNTEISPQKVLSGLPVSSCSPQTLRTGHLFQVLALSKKNKMSYLTEQSGFAASCFCLEDRIDFNFGSLRLHGFLKWLHGTRSVCGFPTVHNKKYPRILKNTVDPSRIVTEAHRGRRSMMSS